MLRTGLSSLSAGDPADVVDQNVALFIDGTIFDICRVRGRNNTQEAFCDGHHHRHALGMQGVIGPNGLLLDIWGMYAGRRHDEFFVNDSGVNTRMRDCQEGNVVQYKIMGDKAYSVRSHIGSPFVGSNVSAEQRAFNLSLSRLRVCVEHGFGKMKKVMSSFVTYEKRMQLFSSPGGRYFVNAAILANCHTCLNGSQVGQYFDVSPPTIQEFLGV